MKDQALRLADDFGLLRGISRRRGIDLVLQKTQAEQGQHQGGKTASNEHGWMPPCWRVLAEGL